MEILHLIEGAADPDMQVLAAQIPAEPIEACTFPLTATDHSFYGPVAGSWLGMCCQYSGACSVRVDTGYEPTDRGLPTTSISKIALTC